MKPINIIILILSIVLIFLSLNLLIIEYNLNNNPSFVEEYCRKKNLDKIDTNCKKIEWSYSKRTCYMKCLEFYEEEKEYLNCSSLSEERLQKCCENWASINKIPYENCKDGKWILSKDKCVWVCP